MLCAEGRHFTAGIELNEWAPLFLNGQGFQAAEGEIDPMGVTGPQHRKPVVIAVQGYCFTWGVEILLNTEIRVAARDTQFQMLEVQRGLYPCGGATLRLPREIGWGNAQRVLLTGERWSAETALRWGMVQEVVETGEQFARAMEIARAVADAAPLGVQGCLQGNALRSRALAGRGGRADDARPEAGDGQRGFGRGCPVVHRTAQGGVQGPLNATQAAVPGSGARYRGAPKRRARSHRSPESG